MNRFAAATSSLSTPQPAMTGRTITGAPSPSFAPIKQINAGAGYTRMMQKKLNIKDVSGALCIPWYGNVCVNDGHSNFPMGHKYAVMGGIVQGLVTVPAVVQTWALSVVKKNQIAISPAAGLTIADLANIGLTSSTKKGDLFVIGNVVANPNDPFAGEYRVLYLPVTDRQSFILENVNAVCDELGPRPKDAIRIRFGDYRQIYLITQIDPTTGAYTMTPTNNDELYIVRQLHVVGCASGH
jgi:hypothetical protein